MYFGQGEGGVYCTYRYRYRYKYTCLLVCDVTVHRQREKALLLLLLLLGRCRGLGLYAFSVDMLFWVLFLFVTSCLNKKWTSFSRVCLVNDRCLEVSHSQRSRLCFLCTSTFFFLRCSRRLLRRDIDNVTNVMWKTVRCCRSHMWIPAVTQTLALSRSIMSPRGVDVLLLICIYIWVMYRTYSTKRLKP